MTAKKPGKSKQHAAADARSPEAPAGDDLQALKDEEIRQTLHSLQVHQVELEAQNEELRQTQAELDAVRARYFDLYDLAPIGYCTVSEQGLILEANLAAATLLGMARGALVGQRWSQFILKQDQSLFHQYGTQLFGTRESQAYELRMVRADGTVFWAQLATVVVQNAGGAPVARIVLSDNPNRERSEQALRESEARWRALFSVLPVGVSILDNNGAITDLNPALERILGIAREDMRQGLHRDRTYLRGDGSLKPAEEFASHRALREQRAVLNEVTGVVKEDGAVVWTSVNAVPLPGAGIVLATTDITERRRTEEALRESEERYRRITEGLTDYQYTVRVEDGRAVETEQSAACARVTGYTAEEYAADPHLWIQMVPPEERDRVREHARRILTGEDTPALEHRIVRKDGAERWVRNTAIVLRDAAGTILSYDGVVSDITERRRAEEEQARLESQLQQAQKLESVGRLAGGVAHDFNNSLQLILLNAEMALRSPGMTAGSRRLLLDIQKTSHHSAQLIAQLMAFARRQTTHPLALDLNEVSASYLPMLRRLVGEGVVIAWEPGPGLGPVWLDPVQYEQVLVNLATNARDAMGGVGRLTLATSAVTLAEATGDVPLGEYVRLAVTDSGCGMDEDVRAHIFEPFFTTKSVGEGTGLGLASVYGIVTQNGGSIAVDSAPGLGTTITIQLPRLVAEAPLHDVGLPALPSPVGTETLLVVEDEPMLLRACAASLRQLGYTVLAATLPSEALRLAEGHAGSIQLLLTDVVMPEMSGRELAERLAAARPGARQLYMSGYSAGVLSERGLADGSVRLLHKPFPLDALARAVRAALDET